jgi:toxin HigB-1
LPVSTIGQLCYAVSASGNWRVTFGWIEGDAIDVDLEDYH